MARSKRTDDDDLVDESPTLKIGIGHNSMSSDDLMKICGELEAINDQKKVLAEAYNEVMAVAKEKGFNPTHIREGLKLRAMDQEKRDDFLGQRDLYLHALGII